MVEKTVADATHGGRLEREKGPVLVGTAEEIAKFAAKAMADSNIMTTHGQGTTKKVRTGSVAMDIISSNRKPVMLMRPPISLIER